MTITASSNAQLFFNTGKGLNQGQSETQQIGANSLHRLEFTLAKSVILGLRFDPGLVPAHYRVHRVFLNDEAGAEISSFPPADIKPHNQIARTYTSSSDVYFDTAPDAKDPGLPITLHAPLNGDRRPSPVQLLYLGIFSVLYDGGDWRSHSKERTNSSAAQEGFSRS